MTDSESLSAVKDAFKNGLTDFIPDMLDAFFAGRLSREAFSHNFVSELNKVKFYLAVMPDELRKANQRTARREVAFADAVNKLALVHREYDDKAFKQKLRKCIEGYLKDSG